MDSPTFQAAANTVIAAPAEEIYAFIADIERMGEISPECTGGTWESDDRGVGALFIGSNAAGDRTWQSRMRVVEARPPHAFAWENVGNPADPITDLKPRARWRYTFTPGEGGTVVEESWLYLSEPTEEALRDGRLQARMATNESGIATTLANLKRVVEG